MLEDDKEQVATLDYCNVWKGLNDVAPPVVADYDGFMWSFMGKDPGTGLIIDKPTMQLVYVTKGGDMDIYGWLFEKLLK